MFVDWIQDATLANSVSDNSHLVHEVTSPQAFEGLCVLMSCAKPLPQLTVERTGELLGELCAGQTAPSRQWITMCRAWIFGMIDYEK